MALFYEYARLLNPQWVYYAREVRPTLFDEELTVNAPTNSALRLIGNALYAATGWTVKYTRCSSEGQKSNNEKNAS